MININSEDWEEVEVQSIAEVFRGSSPRPKGDPRFYGGNVPRLMGADVSRDGKYVTPKIDYLTEEGAKFSRPVPVGTLIIVCSGLVGIPAITAIDCCIHDGFLALRNLSKKVDIEYLYYAFSKLQHRFNSAATHGGVFTNLTTQILKKFTFLLPPLPEQRKIAEILSTWDKAIVKTERLIAALQERKKGLMQRLLTGQVRFPGFDDSWEIHKLGDLLKPIVRKEKIDPRKQYSLIGVRWYVAGAHIHEVIPGNLISTDALSMVHENDVLYNKMWVTKNAFGIARKEHDGAYGSSEYPQFIPKANKVDVNFLGYFFHDTRFQYDAHRLCKGTTGRARLNPGDFLEIETRIPKIAEQIEIAEFLQACDKEIQLLSRKLEALEQQKKGLMQKLLTGQIRVQV